MTLERIGDNFYTVTRGGRVVDRVPVGVIAETCAFAALKYGLDDELHDRTLHDLINEEWCGSRLPEKDLAAIRPKYKKVLKRAISAFQAHVEEVI